MTIIPDNEAVLAHLAEHPASTNAEVVEGTGLDLPRVLMALRRLERSEQIVLVAEDPWRWSTAET